MNHAYMISDLHLGHKNIIKFAGRERGGCTTIEEHDSWIVEMWNSVVNKNDVVYVLGDVAFTREGLSLVRKLKGQKHLIMGNHDAFPIREYFDYFSIIRPSPFSYKGYWLSHCPIHPQELRGRKNVHGHVHNNPVPDSRYISVCVEALGGTPRTLDQLEALQKHYDWESLSHKLESANMTEK